MFCTNTTFANTSKVVASNTAAQDHIKQLHDETNGYKEGTTVLLLHESECLLKDQSFEEV